MDEKKIVGHRHVSKKLTPIDFARSLDQTALEIGTKTHEGLERLIKSLNQSESRVGRDRRSNVVIMGSNFRSRVSPPLLIALAASHCKIHVYGTESATHVMSQSLSPNGFNWDEPLKDTWKLEAPEVELGYARAVVGDKIKSHKKRNKFDQLNDSKNSKNGFR